MQSWEAYSGCAHHEECQHILRVYVGACCALSPELSSRGFLWQALQVGNLSKDLQPKPHWRAELAGLCIEGSKEVLRGCTSQKC